MTRQLMVLLGAMLALALAWPGPAGAATCTITGTEGNDTLTGTAGNDVICGLGGNDTIRGGGGNDVLLGDAGADRLFGEAGNDSLDGRAGNDTLDGGVGADSLIGGTDIDKLTYAARANPLTVTSGDGTANDGEAGEGDNVHADIESILGGKAADHLTGSGAAETLTGGAGADTLDGGAGNDTLDGGAGADDMKGGAGVDTVTYASRTADVTVTLAGGADDGEPGEGDNAEPDIENVAGGAGWDTITGAAAANTLSGNRGDDRLDGGAGADTLNGGAGNDMLAAADGATDRLLCGADIDGFTADPTDSVRDCENRMISIGTFSKPVYLTSPPGDTHRQLVVEETGKMWMLVDGVRQTTAFLDRKLTTLSVAFAPDYATSGLVYVASVRFNTATQDSTVLLDEYHRSGSNPNVADATTQRTVLSVQEPTQLHNGGQLHFGRDGLLYMSFGDGGPTGDPQNHAQDLDLLNGKIIRIDPRLSGSTPYTIPSTNPFVGRPGRDEIWAYGLRNPWRFSFDAGTGDLYIADPGENRMEEVSFAAAGTGAGADYGWSCFEGTLPFNTSFSCPSPVAPVLTYSSGGTRDCAVIGGNVSRDPATPALAGRYLYGDYCSGWVRSFRMSSGTAVESRSEGMQVPSLSSFGADASGRVYALSLDGPVYRIAAP
jgi:hypothetical protein